MFYKIYLKNHFLNHLLKSKRCYCLFMYLLATGTMNTLRKKPPLAPWTTDYESIVFIYLVYTNWHITLKKKTMERRRRKKPHKLQFISISLTYILVYNNILRLAFTALPASFFNLSVVSFVFHFSSFWQWSS